MCSGLEKGVRRLFGNEVAAGRDDSGGDVLGDQPHTTAGLGLEERAIVLRVLGRIEENRTRTPPPQSESAASL
jgi:hypothetical protein